MTPRPVIKVYLLPSWWTDTQFRLCTDRLVRAAASVKTLGVTDEEDILILFPSDRLPRSSGNDIHVEVTVPAANLYWPGDGDAYSIVRAIGTAMQELLPRARIQCKAYPFSASQEAGFWMSGM